MLVIFDFDGVLVDSEAVGLLVEIDALRRLGCRVDVPSYFEAALGCTDEERIWRDFASAAGISLPSDFAERVRAEIAETFSRGLAVMPGAEELLQRLDSMGIPYCLASGSRPERLKRNLALTGLDRFLGNKTFSGVEVPKGKPAPDLFLLAAERMGARPADCVAVEDSPAGVRGARRAGMRVLGFTGGSHFRLFPQLRQRLVEAGAQGLADRLQDIPDLLQEQGGSGDGAMFSEHQREARGGETL